MNRDNVYIFDKITFKRQLLGEIQTDFNMSLVIDGTKDSSIILVNSFFDYEIEPYSILWHEKTNTWWTISHDKVEREENENGFYYTHNIELLGAIELFNARDLTDCGFNDKTYNVGEFIQRLFSLSNLELDVILDENENNFLMQRVDFIKTFENYTLLSALREFLDAYNNCAKLSFTTKVENDETYIDKAYLNIICKAGSNKYTKHDIDFFNDVRETKVLDKNSFGTCVISNANNVVSSQAKIFPSTGFKELSGEEYEITTANAVLRLPSYVYKVNWLKMIATRVHVTFIADNQIISVPTLVYEADEYSKQKIIDRLELALANEYITQETYDYIMNIGIDYIWKKAKEYHTVTFFTDVQYNPDDTYTLGENAPYIPTIIPSVTGDPQKVSLLPKEIRECVQKHGGRIFAMYWERGSNLIRGFEWLEHNHRVPFNYTDGYYNEDSDTAKIYEDNVVRIYARDTSTSEAYLNFAFRAYDTNRQPALFRINYIPMADLKLKVDNQRDKRDIQLYNQNGKLSDSYALSKLIDSYAKEISSDSITRFGQYFDFDSVPKVGSFVTKGNDLYVINNVSMTFYQNENTNNDFGYFIDCEFSMSKWCSTKSAMVSPNTNIRDYGIPQQYNVKRKQVYRDYYELSYNLYSDSNKETPYLAMDYVLPFEHTYKNACNFACHIKLEYEDLLSGEYYWYYQLECTTIICGKQVISICDFKDNNIIGYSAMNREFVFDVAHLFDQWSRINTPISYVDDYGKFKGIYILFLNEKQRTDNDIEYFGQQPEPYDALLTQCFIPEELFEISQNNNSFEINENEYYKDPIEVPFFEYCFQVGDSESVLFGDNVCNQKEDCVYFYSFVKGNDLNQNNVYDNKQVEPNVEFTSLSILNGVSIDYKTLDNNKIIKVGIYARQVRINSSGEFLDQLQETFESGYDYAIFRHSFNLDTNEDLVELMFIVKSVPSDSIDNNGYLILYQNHYKLK